jgi:pilus assembly protein CpaB
MRRSNLVILLVALIMGGAAAFMARAWIERHTTPQTAVATATIVVAAAQLPFGTALTEDNTAEIPWASAQIPEGAFAKKIDLLKDGRRVVLGQVDRSEIVLRSKITAPGQRASLSTLLEEGQRAVTVRVDDVRGVAGFILPGDRVDVVLMRESHPGQGRETENSADVLLEFVKVLAIDQILNERPDQPTVTTAPKAVTLQVNPEQAQKVLLASNIGKLSLVLRQPGESRASQARRITDEDLGPAFARAAATKEAVVAPVALPVPPPKEVDEPAKVTIFHGMDSKTYEVVRE